MLAASDSSSNSSCCCCCDSIELHCIERSSSCRSRCSEILHDVVHVHPALPPTPGLSPHLTNLNGHFAPSSNSNSNSNNSSTSTNINNTRSRSTSIRKRTTMASASISASMAASGYDKRYSSSTASSFMETPGSSCFPSEMARSPMAYSPSLLKGQEPMRTPLTPPSAYLDFLKQMTPAMPSPMSTGTSSRFKFNEEKNEKNEKSEKSVDSADKPVIPSTSTSSNSPPESQPALSRNTSYASNTSTTSTNTSISEHSAISLAASKIEPPLSARLRPESPRIIIPPSQFAKPGQPRSSRTPRRLQIPTSPFSPAMNATGSPYSSTPMSAAPWSASFSPRDADPEANGKPGRVSVRHTVTRTIVYCRTPLEPAPRGKRRKLDDSAIPKVAEIPTSNESSEKVAELPKQEIVESAPPPPPIKQES